MQRLIIRAPLLAGECKDEALEACVPNPSPDDVWKGIIPGAGSTVIPSTFEGVGVKLRREQGSIFLLLIKF